MMAMRKIRRNLEETGKEAERRRESFVGKRKAMEQAVAEIISASDSPETKLQKIYGRVQRVRNTSYEQEKTRQEQKRAKEKESITSRMSGNEATRTAIKSRGYSWDWCRGGVSTHRP